MADSSPPVGWRYYGGWFFFIISFIMPFLSPLIPLLGFNKSISALLIGILLLGGPELTIVIAIGLWGKQTFDYFMNCLMRLLKRFAPAKQVSVTRYYFGLCLLISSFIPSWIIAYAPMLVNDKTRMLVVITSDCVFVISFFILGGNFWEKVRALFKYS